MLKFELQLDGGNLSRGEFMSTFKRLFREFFELEYGWAPTLFFILMEMVKNIYDHGGRRGEVVVQIDADGAIFEVRDFGEGYKGGSAAKDFDSIAEFHENYGSSLCEVSSENLGIGLSLIKGGLDGIQKIAKVEYKIVTSPSFCYSGKITFEESNG